MNYILKIPSNFRGTYPTAGKVFIAGSLLSLVLSGYSWFQASTVEREIEWRKNQLSLPIYRLSQEEHINPPWNNENINEWLYRRVEVTGRQIHRDQCLVPNIVNGADGFECVVPLLVKEDADRSNPQGLIFSRGFLPYCFKDIGTRYRIENAKTQKFVGFVSRLPQLKNASFFDGNSTNETKRLFTNADVQDFVKAAGFINSKEAGVALIERLQEVGVLDERSPDRRAVDCSLTENYPYPKTEAGALQLPRMPWQYRNDSKQYLMASLASLIVGASVF